MKLNNRLLFYLICLTAGSSLFEISAHNVILENKTGYDLIIESKYKSSSEPGMPIIIAESLVTNNTEMPVAFDFIKSCVLEGGKAPDFLLQGITAKYKDFIDSESIVGKSLGGYELELPIDTIKEAVFQHNSDIYVDLFPTSITGGIGFKINSSQFDYANKQIEKEENRGRSSAQALDSIKIINYTRGPVLIKLDIVDKYRFNQVKRSEEFILNKSGERSIPLFIKEDSKETLVTEIYASLLDKKYLPLEVKKEIGKEAEGEKETEKELEEEIIFLETSSINPKDINPSDLNLVPFNLDKITLNNVSKCKRAVVHVEKTEGSSYTPIGKVFGDLTGLYAKGPSVSIDVEYCYH